MFGPHVLQQESFHEMMMEGDIRDEAIMPASFGLVPRAVKEIFDALEYRKKHLALDIDARVSLSYIEIYGDEISDLLKKGATCGQSRVAAQRYVLDGSSAVPVESLYETLQLLDEGEKQKRKAATAMNARSSRAHTLFIVTLCQECTNTGVSATSRLFLVDLGGSEQIKRSQPTVGNRNGEKVDEGEERKRVQEAVNINLGLLALKQCVEGLRKKKHVPYGDSKLTMMLSTGLGGDSKTSVIVCGAQEESHGPETIAAMKFGQTCRGIYNTVKTNVNMLETLLKNIDAKIVKCEQNIRDNEYWVEVDNEILDNYGSLIEVRKKTVVAGAVSYRRELADLIRQKSELTGETVDNLLYSSPAAVEGFGDFHQYTSEGTEPV
jgi:kinesin family protein 5